MSRRSALRIALLSTTGLPIDEQLGILLTLSAYIAGHARLMADITRTETGEGAPMGTLMAHLAGTGRLPTGVRRCSRELS